MSHHFRRDAMADGYRASFEEPTMWPPPTLDRGRSSHPLNSSATLSNGNGELGSLSRQSSRADNRDDLMALGIDVKQDDDLGELLSQLSKYSSDYHNEELEPTPSVPNIQKQQQLQSRSAEAPHFPSAPSKKSAVFEPRAASHADNVPLQSRSVDDDAPLIEEAELQAILEQLSSSGVDLERALQDPLGRQRLLQSIIEQQQHKKFPESRSLAGGRDGPVGSFPPYQSASTTTPVFLSQPPPPAGDRAWHEAMRVFQEQLERSRVLPPKRERTSSNSSADSRAKRRRSKHDTKTKKKKKEKEEKLDRKKQKEAAEEAMKLQQQRKAEEKALTEQITELIGKKELLMKRSELLKEELGRLERQYNELCRKMQRVKEGHKAPLLQENLRLQTEIEKQLSGITNTVTEINKVLANAAARLNKLKKHLEQNEKDKSANKSTPTKEKVNRCEVNKSCNDEKSEAPLWFEYFDAGSHWCKVCNVIVASLFDMLAHVHTVAHKANLDVKEAPWMPERVSDPSKRPMPPIGVQTRVIPIKGVEFLVPSNAFYCTLCREFAGDPACAEDHLKSEMHRICYERMKSEHPLYERTYNMDKAASMTKRTQMAAAANGVRQEAFEEGLHLVQRNTIINKKPPVPNNDPLPPSRIVPRMEKLQMKIIQSMTAGKPPMTAAQKSLPNTIQLKERVLVPRHVAEQVLFRQKIGSIPVDAVRKRSHSPKPSRSPSHYHRNRSRSRSASRRSRNGSRGRRRRFSRSRSPSPHHQQRHHERSRSRERRLASSPPRPATFTHPRGRTFVIDSSGPATKTKPVVVKSEAAVSAEAKQRQRQDHATEEGKAPIAKRNKQKPQAPTKNSVAAKKTIPMAPSEFIASFRLKECIGELKSGKRTAPREKLPPAVVSDVDTPCDYAAVCYGPALPNDLVPSNNDADAKGNDAGGEIRSLVSNIVTQVDQKEAVN